jgi:type I restriction enzyme M protein
LKVEHVAMTATQFEKRLTEHKERLKSLFNGSHLVEKSIEEQLKGLRYGN